MNAPAAPIRQGLEAALTDDELAVLASLCAAAAVPLSRWHLVPAIARPFTLLAVERLAQGMNRRGVVLKTARQLAAHRIGVKPETLKSWRYRWSEDAHGVGSGAGVRNAPPTSAESL